MKLVQIQSSWSQGCHWVNQELPQQYPVVNLILLMADPLKHHHFFFFERSFRASPYKHWIKQIESNWWIKTLKQTRQWPNCTARKIDEHLRTHRAKDSWWFAKFQDLIFFSFFFFLFFFYSMWGREKGTYKKIIKKKRQQSLLKDSWE